MLALQFENKHAAEWQALEQLLDQLEASRRPPGADAAAAARAYRRVCEHLALAQSRGYPLHLSERLDALAQRAHRLIYRRPTRALHDLRQLAFHRFPNTLRAHGRYLLVATLVFTLPLLALLVACWLEPSMALTVLSAEHLSEFDEMYGDGRNPIGRDRSADTDWMMFGFYIRNNISVAFQCFATGLAAGLGSLFFMAYNGALAGAVGGYLQAHGLGHNFWPFVATHSAFELTAIVIAGAAGLRLGHALLAPGRLTRRAALRAAAADGAVLVGGAALMLMGAAVLEAFWSSARWVPVPAKLALAALCWAGVAAYCSLAGRGQDAH